MTLAKILFAVCIAGVLSGCIAENAGQDDVAVKTGDVSIVIFIDVSPVVNVPKALSPIKI